MRKDELGGKINQMGNFLSKPKIFAEDLICMGLTTQL